MKVGNNLIGFVGVLMTLFGFSAWADEISSPALKNSIEQYKQTLVKWASNPAIVEAVKASNSSGDAGSIAGMTNAKWNLLEDNDPLVIKFKDGPAGQLVVGWEDTHKDSLSKIYVRDKNGNLVASSRSKALVYNNRTKPPFENAMKGEPWAANEIKPDPGSQVRGVHVSVPVIDDGKPIGIIHTSVIAK